MCNSALSLPSALDGIGWSTSHTATLAPWKTVTHCIGGWVGLRDGLDGCGKSHIWIQMRVLWCFRTSACIYFLSSPNCIYSNLLRDVLFLRTSLCYSVFYVGISAWNQSLYIYKNTDIPKRLCLIEGVCHHAGVGSIPARYMWPSGK